MPIWTSPLSLEEITEVSRRTASGHLGVTFTAVGSDWLEGCVPLHERTRDAGGAVHHGALAILAETLGSVGATMCVDRSRQACLGQTLHLQYRGTPAGGPLVGRAAPVWMEPLSQLWEIRIRDADRTLVCDARLTVAVVDRLGAPAERRA